MTYAIKYLRGGYYTGMTGIGPAFGGDETTAVRFRTWKAANAELGKHSYAFAMADVVKVASKPAKKARKARTK